MRRYLGSRITAFAAIVCPLFIISPLCFAVIILFSEISEATLLLSALFCSCTVIWFVYTKKEALQLYAWGEFGKTDVQVRCFLKNNFVLNYAKCTSVGIEYYKQWQQRLREKRWEGKGCENLLLGEYLNLPKNTTLCFFAQGRLLCKIVAAAQRLLLGEAGRNLCFLTDENNLFTSNYREVKSVFQVAPHPSRPRRATFPQGKA